MRILVLALLTAAAGWALPTCTQISDTLYGADGNVIASGTLRITTTTTATSNGATVIPKAITVPLASGVLSVCLVPNTYEVVYQPGQFTRQWVVPAGGPYTVLEIEQTPTNTVPAGSIALSMLASGNATTGQAMCWSGSAWGPGSCGGGGAGAVASVFGRTGVVTSHAGDYTASQVTNAVDSTGSYANPSWLTGLAWSKLSGVPSLVNSFNLRTGAVVPVSGDYTASQVTNAVDSTGSYTNPAWISSLAWSKLSSVPSLVNSFNLRTGAVVPVSGDYTASQVTNAVDQTGSYANPAWITSLAWSKLSGVPSLVNSFNTRTGAVVPTTGDYTCSMVTSCSTGPTSNQNLRSIGAAFDGGGTALSGSLTRCTHLPFAGTIQGVTLIADQTGSATVDVRTVAYASYTGPASASSIAASAIPALSSALKYTDTTLTGWTTSISANTEVCFALSAPSTLTWAQITLKIAAN